METEDLLKHSEVLANMVLGKSQKSGLDPQDTLTSMILAERIIASYLFGNAPDQARVAVTTGHAIFDAYVTKLDTH